MSARLLRLPLGCVVFAGALVLASCSDDAEIASSKIFRGPVWTGAESVTYRVATRGVDGVAECTFITPAELTGERVFEQVCRKDQYGDDRQTLADAATLIPMRADRVNTDDEKGTRLTHSIVYGPGEATFTTDDGKKSRETTRELPKPTGKSPDPGYYDDDTLFWMARGLPFEEGWTGGYHHVINAGQPRVLPVEVVVQRKERVKVPAGEREAWRVRFERGSTVYVLWVDTAAPHLVVKAAIEDTLYELEEAK